METLKREGIRDSQISAQFNLTNTEHLLLPGFEGLKEHLEQPTVSVSSSKWHYYLSQMK